MGEALEVWLRMCLALWVGMDRAGGWRCLLWRLWRDCGGDVGTRGRRIACHIFGLGSIANLGPTVNSRHIDQNSIRASSCVLAACKHVYEVCI